MTNNKIIHTTDAPAAVGPYSQAIRTNGWVFTAGQIGIDPASGQLVEGLDAQTRQVLKNLNAVLLAGGSSLADVVKTTIFLIDMAHFPQVNAIYGQVLGETLPARSTVQVAALPLGALIEIEAIAVARD